MVVRSKQWFITYLLVVYCVLLLSSRKEVDQNKMLKITIEVQEDKKEDKCHVTIKNQKDLSKCSENEKRTGAMVRNEIEKALHNLED